jgi:hypothetical protein
VAQRLAASQEGLSFLEVVKSIFQITGNGLSFELILVRIMLAILSLCVRTGLAVGLTPVKDVLNY